MTPYQAESLKKETVEELAQKLFTEAGYPGDVYEAEPALLRRFENKAQIIMEGK